MKLFEQLCVLDDCRLTYQAYKSIQHYSTQKILQFSDTSNNREEIIQRIGEADAVLVSWKTKIDEYILSKCSNLKYIGLCCSLYNENASNVAISSAKQLGICVKGVRDYGDEGTVEFIIAQLISLMKGINGLQFKPFPSELTGKTIGIIGLGTVGKMLANAALHFGMIVNYHSRTRNRDFEAKGIKYLEIDQLMKSSDIVSTHLPKHTYLLNSEHFKSKKRNSIFINTSLGATFEFDDLKNWLQEDNSSYAIFDSDGAGIYYENLSKIPQVILYPSSAGFTSEARERLSDKVISNIEAYLSNC